MTKIIDRYVKSRDINKVIAYYKKRYKTVIPVRMGTETIHGQYWSFILNKKIIL